MHTVTKTGEACDLCRCDVAARGGQEEEALVVVVVVVVVVVKVVVVVVRVVVVLVEEVAVAVAVAVVVVVVVAAAALQPVQVVLDIPMPGHPHQSADVLRANLAAGPSFLRVKRWNSGGQTFFISLHIAEYGIMSLLSTM